MDNRERREEINRELLAEIIAATPETIQEAVELLKAFATKKSTEAKANEQNS